MFTDREDAGRQLAAQLSSCAGLNPLVLAIPRGAVPMAHIIAQALGGELDVVLVHKLGAPFNPEYAIGSVDETGWVYVTPEAAAAGATPEYLEREQSRQIESLRQRRTAYTPFCPPVSATGRTAIVVDDGLATGATMIAALHAVRSRDPARLIAAVPVAPPDTLERVRPHADEVVCLLTPPHFGAVSQFYAAFPEVTDDTVMTILKEAGRKPR